MSEPRYAGRFIVAVLTMAFVTGCALYEPAPPKRGLDPESVIPLEAPPPGPNEADIVVSAELSKPVLAGISPPPPEYPFTVVVDGRGLASEVRGEAEFRKLSPVARVRAVRYAFITRIRTGPGTVSVGLHTWGGSAETTVELAGGEVMEVAFKPVYRSAGPLRRSFRLAAPGEDLRRGLEKFEVEVRPVEEPGPDGGDSE